MLRWTGLALAALMLPTPAQAGAAGDALVAHLYAGTAAAGLPDATEACYTLDQEACFAQGLLQLVLAYEGVASDLYRYGAVVPGSSAAGLIFGFAESGGDAPANPAPEQLSYTALRTVLADFLTDLDAARVSFERAGEIGDYVISIDPLKVRIDLDGNGTATPGETLAVLMSQFDEAEEFATDFPPPEGGKTKTKPGATDTSVGFDRADALWFAGYTQVTSAPIELILAHDFSAFYDVYLHRVFPRSGLPMQDYSQGGMLFMDPESDAGIADLIAGIHTLNFPVTDADRLANVLARLKAITALSRQNWDAILAETDDARELVPSPNQTTIFPGMVVTDTTVAAWRATLDTIDQVLAGDLLVPHWRFSQGFDLNAYFTTANNTDLVLLISGSAALPYLKDGPIADGASFAAANDAFGADWLNYAFWFN